MSTKTPITNKLVCDLEIKIASSDYPTLELQSAFESIAKLARNLEIINSRWDKLAKEFNCNTAEELRNQIIMLKAAKSLSF